MSRTPSIADALARYGWQKIASGRFLRGSIELWLDGLSVSLRPGPVDMDRPGDYPARLAFRDFVVAEWLDPEFVAKVAEGLARSVEQEPAT